MGLPLHAIKKELRDSWIDTLRNELAGYATVAVVDDSTEDDSTEETLSVYVVGNHGYFTIHQHGDYFPDYLSILMFPFNCSVKSDGQDMVNLEERIHRTFDTMSITFEPEKIERYEKSRWTRFFRLFGWEHVGSLDFAHRPKKEIVEGNFDSQPIRSRFNLEEHIQCRPEFKECWTNMFQERLEGRAAVKLTSSSIRFVASSQCLCLKSEVCVHDVSSPRTIVSPNGNYRIETPISLEIEGENECYFLRGEGENGIYWISSSYDISMEESRKKLRSKPIGRIIDDTLREIAVDEKTLEAEASPTALDDLPKSRSKIVLAAGLTLLGAIFSFFVCCLSLSLEMVFDPLPTPHGFITLPLAIGAAIFVVLQYRALFCCPPIAARVYFGWLSAIYGLPIMLLGGIGFIVRIFGPINEEGIPLPMAFVMLLMGTGFLSLDIAAAVVMKRRRRMARDAGWPGIELLRKKSPPFRDYWKRELFGIVLAAFITSLVCWSWIHQIPPASGEYPAFSQLPIAQVPAFKNFPEDGHDFKFKRAHRHRMFCEFTITEQGFKDWAVSQKQWTGCKEIRDYLVPTKGLAPDPIYVTGLLVLPETENGPSTAFDRRTNKTYFWKH